MELLPPRWLLATAAIAGVVAQFVAIPFTSAFILVTPNPSMTQTQLVMGLAAAGGSDGDPFELSVDLPGAGDLSAKMKFQPVLEGPSEIVEVRYKLPFGLAVEPKNNFAMCTKDGPGGEKVGDILRYTSQWTLGLPRGDGVITTAMSFSGGISWQCSLFDVMRAERWEQVVQALTSNVEGRTDEVVLLFERPLPEEK